MWKPAEAVVLTPSQRRQLEQIARHPRTTQKVALRVAIILGAAEGLSNRELARRLGTSRPTVLLWRSRFEEAGVEGLLHDASRPGRHKQIRQGAVAKILRMTLEERPREATHWSTRTLAARCGVSHMTVHRIWRAYGLQPHLVERFKLPTDPDFVAGCATLWACT
jgi:transposase